MTLCICLGCATKLGVLISVWQVPQGRPPIVCQGGRGQGMSTVQQLCESAVQKAMAQYRVKPQIILVLLKEKVNGENRRGVG